jgi:hypothetical protein
MGVDVFRTRFPLSWKALMPISPVISQRTVLISNCRISSVFPSQSSIEPFFDNV